MDSTNIVGKTIPQSIHLQVNMVIAFVKSKVRLSSMVFPKRVNNIYCAKHIIKHQNEYRGCMDDTLFSDGYRILMQELRDDGQNVHPD